MIKSAFWAFCLLLFIACKKTNTTASIVFKINGVQVQFAGGRDTAVLDPITGFNYGCYATKPSGSNFYTIDGDDGNNKIQLVIAASQSGLLPMSYTGGAVEVLATYQDTSYGSARNYGSASINISSFSNGIVNGTFSATALDTNANVKTITQGQFSNIRVYP
jgi:hypothetical protein